MTLQFIPGEIYKITYKWSVPMFPYDVSTGFLFDNVQYFSIKEHQKMKLMHVCMKNSSVFNDAEIFYSIADNCCFAFQHNFATNNIVLDA